MSSSQVSTRLFFKLPIDVERIICAHLSLIDFQKAAATSRGFYSRFLLEISRFFGTWTLAEQTLEDAECRKQHAGGCYSKVFYTLNSDKTFTGYHTTHHFLSRRDRTQRDTVMSGTWKLQVGKSGKVNSIKVLLSGKAVYSTVPPETVCGYITASRPNAFSAQFIPYGNERNAYGKELKYHRSNIP